MDSSKNKNVVQVGVGDVGKLTAAKQHPEYCNVCSYHVPRHAPMCPRHPDVQAGLASRETDPNGIDQHAPGAKLDAGKLRPSLILSSMPRALKAVAAVGTYGANKYTDDGWQHVENGVKRYTDALDRHRLEEGIETYDRESGLRHAAHLAWNALARLELILRELDVDPVTTQHHSV